MPPLFNNNNHCHIRHYHHIYIAPLGCNFKGAIDLIEREQLRMNGATVVKTLKRTD